MLPTAKATKRVIVAAIAAATLALAPAAAAHADTPDVLLSADGSHYAATLHAGLFPASARIIPRGVQHATLYVKNPTSHAAILAIHATGIVVSRPDAAGALSLRASSAGATNAPSVNLATKSTCARLLTGQPMPAGTSVRVDLTVAMADVTGHTAQDASAQANLVVSLSDAAGPRSATDSAVPAMASGCVEPGVIVPAFVPADSASAHFSSLSDTGSNIISALGLMSTLLGIGIYLLFASRRRREES